ncbi:MAG: TetR/AcrR family transcriptional regulator [Ornithinimicrobium sp.]
MIPERNIDTRTALLEAAADLISASPGQEVPLRAICERVGVRLPTLYHHFGSKEGLIDAVIGHGFDLYLDVKTSHESTGDPIEDIRAGWDAHAAFGVDNPGFYALMYGKVVPGYRPLAQQRATTLLRGLTESADEQGRLVISAHQAADHVLAANVGTTLHLITSSESDWSLSASVRDATLAAITGQVHPTTPNEVEPLSAASARLLRSLGEHPSALDEPEQVLLRKWLALLARPFPSDVSMPPTTTHSASRADHT